ncbi:MAG: RDD family protein, partial [Candidatus Hodarchaeales archaeon]
RIEYKEVGLAIRLIALVIDVVIGAFIAIFMQWGTLLEYDLLWSKLFNLEAILPYLVYLWFIIFFPVYHILCSSFTDGQTVGKMLLKIKVVTIDNNSTKRAFKLHLKRFFFIREGTKVVREYDPGVKGL